LTVVLWASRHDPLQAQVGELTRRLGEVRIVQARGPFPSVEVVLREADRVGADIIVPVLSLDMIRRLCERRGSKTILWSRMRILHEDCPGQLLCPEFDHFRDVYLPGPPPRHYRFQKFVEILEVNLVTREW